MIVTAQDLEDFDRAFERSQFIHEMRDWIVENPHVFMASGFQEYVAPLRHPMYRKLVRSRSLREDAYPLFRRAEGDWVTILDQETSCRDDEWDGVRVEQYSTEESSLGLATPKDLRRLSIQEILERTMQLLAAAAIKLPSFNAVYRAASKLVDNPLLDPTVFVSPQLWTPCHQDLQKNILQQTAIELIVALQREAIDLGTIHWRDFECIVAELFRSRGMEIHVADEVPQGGRDIIARAEFVPGGEVLTIAIEVKHRALVDRPMIQQALRQNCHFPALMFVTSGRFTTGVLREVAKPDNRMRLFLKDGVAINQMIRAYSL